MELVYKTFDELTSAEVYELLRARSEIFVVEQTCVYQDIDGIDYRSVHVFYKNDDGSVAGCLRLYTADMGQDVIQLGRMLTVKHGTGLGGKLLHAGVEYAKKHMNAKKIFLHAQKYAIGFYAKEGFEVCSEEFLEDEIPHVEMELVCG